MPGQKVAKDIDDRNPYFLSLTCGRPRVFDHAIAFEAARHAKTGPRFPKQTIISAGPISAKFLFRAIPSLELPLKANASHTLG